jgi:hypothetical protein
VKKLFLSLLTLAITATSTLAQQRRATPVERLDELRAFAARFQLSVPGLPAAPTFKGVRANLKPSLFAPRAAARPRPQGGDDFPRSELFAGYAFGLLDGGEDGYIGTHGWNASVSGNFTGSFGLVGDFSGYYGRNTVLGRVNNVAVRADADYKVYTFLVGPQFSARRESVTPFVRALFGVARADVKGRGSVAGVGQVVEIKIEDTAFAAAFGGGVDVRLTDRVWWRAIQADYILTRFDTIDETFQVTQRGNQHNFRLATGLVFR